MDKINFTVNGERYSLSKYIIVERKVICSTVAIGRYLRRRLAWLGDIFNPREAHPPPPPTPRIDAQVDIQAGSEVSPSTTLNDFLRNTIGLVGTKAMCHEGGCGVCVVSVAKAHPGTNEKHVLAVNSCLVHILSCHEWDITTIEGVGNRKDGYNELQIRLATFNGTQCGYCTPGWIMNMYRYET
ncbi:jg4481 [Pararge aegeria aegeria]|uniref:Jg4481 protein n=1 Tax=Pararge aegeria aegeria TaxID=348720 RepID=A0A8S4QU92_9NEOP|nr:jg4481 [Pararge aegeria aegeria]